MNYLKAIVALLWLFLAGCTSTTQYIYAFKGSTVFCHSAVDRPVKVNTDVSPSGNTVPLAP